AAPERAADARRPARRDLEARQRGRATRDHRPARVEGLRPGRLRRDVRSGHRRLAAPEVRPREDAEHQGRGRPGAGRLGTGGGGRGGGEGGGAGGGGVLGSDGGGRLLADGYEVVGVDDLSYGSTANLAECLEDPRFSFEVLDCTQRRPLRQAFDGCDAIFHLAAKKIPRFGGTLSTLEINVGGVNAAAAVAMSLDADLIFTSTSDVYGKATPP